MCLLAHWLIGIAFTYNSKWWRWRKLIFLSIFLLFYCNLSMYMYICNGLISESNTLIFIIKYTYSQTNEPMKLNWYFAKRTNQQLTWWLRHFSAIVMCFCVLFHSRGTIVCDVGRDFHTFLWLNVWQELFSVRIFNSMVFGYTGRRVRLSPTRDSCVFQMIQILSNAWFIFIFNSSF